MNSILSFPTRGKYGKSNYPGNCSGFVIKELLNFFRPKVYVDPAIGSGTSTDVVKELNETENRNLEYFGFDLHSGFNLLKDNLADHIGGKRADYVFFHPPYWKMYEYSKIWGKTAHADDLSMSPTYEEFLAKMVVAVRNIYDSLSSNGAYSILIGDYRKNGEYISIQSDLLKILPGKLDGVLIKEQHNCTSERISYHNTFIKIAHEYVLNFRNNKLLFGALNLTLNVSKKLFSLSRVTWKATIWNALRSLGGQATLPELYQRIQAESPDKTENRQYWRERVRAELQRSFRPISRGIWTI